MERYVGLTDEPSRAVVQAGWPEDWALFPFNVETHATAWVERLARGGYRIVPGDGGWRYGYTFSRAAVRGS